MPTPGAGSPPRTQRTLRTTIIAFVIVEAIGLAWLIIHLSNR